MLRYTHTQDALSLTIFGSSFASIFRGPLSDAHQAAVTVLSGSDDLITQRHVHGGKCVSVMGVHQGGTVLPAHQLKTQEMLEINK